MAFSRHTVGDQSPSERLCLYPDSGSLTRARNLGRGSHLDVLSPTRGSVTDPRFRRATSARRAFLVNLHTRTIWSESFDERAHLVGRCRFNLAVSWPMPT